MKKLTVILSIAVLSFALTTACQQSKDKSNQTETEAEDSKSEMETEKVSYTCTMHPEINEDKPGKCPKCGMELVKKEAHDEMDHNHTDSTMHE